MPRERSPDRDKAKQIWFENNGKLKLKDLAAELGLRETQIRKWKSQDCGMIH
ncbi:phage terminase small subunit-related protein [Paenibacillus anseongensis]|uniref:phage terminase small subunit-related protein n=1 Tax=Paenibacillus TaxID=44249 RepID=UPI001FEA2635|nr:MULTISPECIES: phage terminase small subunit-related protein [Paenibacillus]